MADGRQFADQEWERRMEESDRRFYRNINEIRLQWGMPPIIHPSLQAENDENARSVFIKIHYELFSISCEILDCVFSGFGVVESIEKLSPPIGFHSKIRFRNKASAIQTVDSLNGRNIYDRCCQLELFLVNESKGGPSISDLSSDKEVFTESFKATSKPMVLDNSETKFVGDHEKVQESVNIVDVFGLGGVQTFHEEDVSPLEEPRQEIRYLKDTHPAAVRYLKESHPAAVEDGEHLYCDTLSEPSMPISQMGAEANEDERPHQHTYFKVNPNPLAELVHLLIEWLEIRLAHAKKVSRTGLRMNSIASLRNLISAHKVLVKMTDDTIVLLESKKCLGLLRADQNLPWDEQCCYLDLASDMNLVFDPGGRVVEIEKWGTESFKMEFSDQEDASSSLDSAYCSLMFTKKMRILFPFDRGRVVASAVEEFVNRKWVA